MRLHDGMICLHEDKIREYVKQNQYNLTSDSDKA